MGGGHVESSAFEVSSQMQRFGRATSWVVSAVGVLAVSVVAVGWAEAQMQAWQDIGYFSINYSYQSGDRAFGESLSETVFAEEATYDVSHLSGGGGQFDVGWGLRVWRNLAAGVAVTSFSTADGAVITGSVPHPLFFSRPRSASFARADLEHKELGVHVQAAWVIPINEKISVTVAGGPSFFSVDQSLISGVTTSEIGAPFDAVAIASAATASVSESGVGGNVGVDTTYMVTEQLGGGLFVRWAGGTVDIPANGGTQSIDVGGVQVGIGLRARF
ncbi:MAG: hypothetical protein CL477_12510 [Acidobacteria bacterium]|nr:hypothetical protein [Acidobacteriota bacterium]